MRTLIASSTVAALLLGVSSIAMAQSGSGAFCLKKQQSQANDCAYQTMAQCESAKVSQSDLCSPRGKTQAGSTDAGSATSGAAPMATDSAGAKDPQEPKGRAMTPAPDFKADKPASKN